MRAAPNHVNLLAVIGGLSLIGACVGTEVGNPQTSDVTLEFSGYDSQQRGALTLADGIEITEAWLVFDELRLREAANCSGSDETDYDQAFAVELISGREFPSLDMLSSGATRYCRMELRFAESDLDSLPAGVPAELDGLSMLVRGSYDGTPFVVRDDYKDTFRMDGDFTLSASREPLLVAFALDEWLAADELDGADGDAEILIDADNNSDLLDSFRDNLKRSAALFRDANEDGELQADETDELADGDVDDDSSSDDEADAGDSEADAG